MKLTEKKDHYLIEDLFPGSIVAGFTKTALEGRDVEREIKSVLSAHAGADTKVAFMRQLHSGVVHNIDKEGVYDGDALFTGEKGVALVVKTADCLPLFFYDEKNDSVGVLHLGWRPAKEGILDNIGIDFTSARVLAGVALRQCCFEVTDEFLSFRKLAPFVKKRGEKLYFDPVGFSRSVLAAKGIKEGRFNDLNMCTMCHSSNFFSFRRDKTEKRTLSFIIKR
jgi:YfiH family protein